MNTLVHIYASIYVIARLSITVVFLSRVTVKLHLMLRITGSRKSKL